MDVKISREFKGYINTVKFDDRNIFNLTKEALNSIVYNFGEVFTDEFIFDLSIAIGKCLYKEDGYPINKLDYELIEYIQKANSFEEIAFKIIYFDEVNEEIKRGTYRKEITKKTMDDLSVEDVVSMLTEQPELIEKINEKMENDFLAVSKNREECKKRLTKSCFCFKL